MSTLAPLNQHFSRCAPPGTRRNIHYNRIKHIFTKLKTLKTFRTFKGKPGNRGVDGVEGPQGPQGSLFVIPLNLGVGGHAYSRAAHFRQLLQQHLVRFVKKTVFGLFHSLFP